MARPQLIDDLIEAGTVIVGGPETVRQRLAEYQGLAGFDTSLTKTPFGTLPADVTRANMDAIAEEVPPYFQERGADEPT